MIHIQVSKDGRKMIVTDKHIRQFAFIWMGLGALCVVLPGWLKDSMHSNENRT